MSIEYAKYYNACKPEDEAVTIEELAEKVADLEARLAALEGTGDAEVPEGGEQENPEGNDQDEVEDPQEGQEEDSETI